MYFCEGDWHSPGLVISGKKLRYILSMPLTSTDMFIESSGRMKPDYWQTTVLPHKLKTRENYYIKTLNPLALNTLHQLTLKWNAS